MKWPPDLKFKRPQLGKMGKKALIIWIVYQAIKGVLTTSLIWIPLLWHFLRK
jgi:hypothetical protein